MTIGSVALGRSSRGMTNSVDSLLAWIPDRVRNDEFKGLSIRLDSPIVRGMMYTGAMNRTHTGSMWGKE